MAASVRKYYPGITLFKLIGCVLVVFGHVRFNYMYKIAANYITGLDRVIFIIVPCFYIISGFLAYQGWVNANNPNQYIKKYLKWIIGIYLFIFLIYLVNLLVIPSHFWHHTLIKRIRVSNLLAVLFVRGPFIGFWFMPPLIFSIFFSYVFERRQLLRYACAIAITAFVGAQFFGGTIRSIIEIASGHLLFQPFKYSGLLSAFVFGYFGIGLPFVIAGVFIAKNEGWFMQLNRRRLALFSIGFAIIECLFLTYCMGGTYPYPLVLSMAPISIWLFYALLKVKNHKVKTYHKPINLLSIVMFFSHGIFIKLNLIILGWNFATITSVQSLICFFITVAEASVLALLILLIKRDKQTIMLVHKFRLHNIR